jgi:hypothetical protein
MLLAIYWTPLQVCLRITTQHITIQYSAIQHNTQNTTLRTMTRIITHTHTIMTCSITTLRKMTLSMTKYNIMTFSIMTLTILTLSMTTFSIITYSLMTLTIALSKTTLRQSDALNTDIYNNDTRHNDTQHNKPQLKSKKNLKNIVIMFDVF